MRMPALVGREPAIVVEVSLVEMANGGIGRFGERNPSRRVSDVALGVGVLSPARLGPVTAPQSVPVALKQNGIDRLQLTAWALLRSQSATVGAAAAISPSTAASR